MCEQRAVVEKIVEHNEVNGFGVELAQAQMKDYIAMDRKVTKIDKDVAFIKKEQKRQGEMLARQGGQIDLIVNRLNSPIEAERKDAIFWQQIKSIAKTPTGKVMILLMIGSVALAGQRILELLGLIK
jgi:trans-2-enoyl-CoA reductase